MGYTHYWERTSNFEQQPFHRIVADCKKLLPLLEHVGIPLAGCDGKGVPEFTDEQIAFNGVAGCGHEQRNLGITWPSRGAHGVAGAVQRGPPVTVAETLRAALTGKSEALALRDSDVSDQWLAGCTVCTRTCDGDCSHAGPWQQGLGPDGHKPLDRRNRGAGQFVQEGHRPAQGLYYR